MIGLMPINVPIHNFGQNELTQITGTGSTQLRVGDIAIAVQSRTNTTSLPTLPTGWTSLASGSRTETSGDATARVSMRICAKVITSGDIGSSISNLNELYRVRNNRAQTLPLTAAFGFSGSTSGLKSPVSVVSASVGQSIGSPRVNGLDYTSYLSASESYTSQGGFNGFSATANIRGYVYFWPGDFSWGTLSGDTDVVISGA